jgi:hypothetical protein
VQYKCMLFYKEHKNEMKYLQCGKSRFIEVVNEHGEKVTMKITHKITFIDKLPSAR